MSGMTKRWACAMAGPAVVALSGCGATYGERADWSAHGQRTGVERWDVGSEGGGDGGGCGN